MVKTHEAIYHCCHVHNTLLSHSFVYNITLIIPSWDEAIITCNATVMMLPNRTKSSVFGQGQHSWSAEHKVNCKQWRLFSFWFWSGSVISSLTKLLQPMYTCVKNEVKCLTGHWLSNETNVLLDDKTFCCFVHLFRNKINNYQHPHPPEFFQHEDIFDWWIGQNQWCMKRVQYKAPHFCQNSLCLFVQFI